MLFEDATLFMKLHLLILLSIAFVSGSFAASTEDDFTSTCSRVIRSLRDSDWKGFKNESADVVLLEMMSRFSLRDPHLTPKAARWFVSPGRINCDYRDDAKTLPDTNDRYILITHSVSMTAETSPEERKAFANFCKFVRQTSSTYSLHKSLNIEDSKPDMRLLFGPAITGKICAGSYWGIQMELISGHWRVRKLITQDH
jgi:hypothetical protein